MAAPILTTTQSIQERLGDCRSTREIRLLINDNCAGFGEIINVTLLCGKQNPGQTLCVVDFTQEASHPGLCASVLGGRVFGFNSVVFSFSPHRDLGCVRGFPAGSPSCSCIANA